MKIRAIAALVLALCCLFTGCTVKPTGMDELLRAPRLTGEQNGVQKALASYLGEAPQLKYPSESIQGSVLSPFLMEDLDGDGNQDAAVFYISQAKGQNVHVAVLEKKPSGEWYVTQEKEGLAPAIESVATAELQPGEGRQLLVGYKGSSGEKSLAVYSYKDSTLEEILTQPYSQYQLHPFVGDDASDLIVIGSQSSGPLQIQLLTAQDGRFTLARQLDLSEHFQSCDGLYPSVGEGGSRYLVLDGHTGTGLASMILHYDSRLHQLDEFVPITQADFFSSTQRFSPLLRSMDVNGDGRIEIPCPANTDDAAALTLNQLTLVSWMDFTSEDEQEVLFGAADLEYGYFLALPRELKGKIMITSGDTPDSWQMRSLDGETLYLTVQVAAPGERNPGYYWLGNIGAQKVQAHGSAELGMSWQELKKGFFAL